MSDDKTHNDTFEAWGFNKLYSKMICGQFFVIVHAKKYLAFWGIGFEIMAEPKGFCLFIGPISIGFFYSRAAQ